LNISSFRSCCLADTFYISDYFFHEADAKMAPFEISHPSISTQVPMSHNISFSLKPKNFHAFPVALKAPVKSSAALMRAGKHHADQVYRK